MALKVDDAQTVLKMIRDEIKSFAKNADSILTDELFDVKQALDGANKNIFKLQAQITALKELMINKGMVGRQTLFENENDALKDLIEKSIPRKEVVEARG